MSSVLRNCQKRKEQGDKFWRKKNTFVFFLVIGGFKPMQANKLFHKEIGVDFAPLGFPPKCRMFSGRALAGLERAVWGPKSQILVTNGIFWTIALLAKHISHCASKISNRIPYLCKIFWGNWKFRLKRRAVLRNHWFSENWQGGNFFAQPEELWSQKKSWKATWCPWTSIWSSWSVLYHFQYTIIYAMYSPCKVLTLKSTRCQW